LIKFDIDDLYLIRALDEGLSLSAAATKLGVEDSTASRRIAKIEKIIGLQIFQRRGKFQLTAAGKRFLAMAVPVLKEHDDFQRDIEVLKRGKNSLRIIGNSSIMISDIPQVIEILRVENPDIFVSIRSASMTEIIKKIQENECDVGIVPDKSRVHGISFHKYRTDQLCVFAPISHPLAQKDTATLEDVSQYKLIGTDETRQISSLLQTMAKRQNLVLDYAMTVSNFDLQANLIAQTDIGVGIIFESVARRFINNQRLSGKDFEPTQSIKIVTLTEEWAQRDLYLCTPDPANISPLATEFVAQLKLRHKPVRKLPPNATGQ